MSTEHQQYSLNNQELAIHQYAEKHGFAVTHTYTDVARSGLVLKWRAGLRQLLQDVMTGHAPFKAILVYDVSRWGRFQDSDEAAHYEFMCKAAGVPVHYCAEVFSNDGSTPNSIMKALKRSMAGEYSRELGVKVRAGQKYLAGLGFKQGGAPGYGLRRMLVSPDRSLKQLLGDGERKSIATDRVVLVLGPDDEIRVVRDIYRMLISDGQTVSSIATDLNQNGVPYVNGADWDHSAVKSVLMHPKYMGCHVYGRTAQRLGGSVTRNPTSEWIMSYGAHEALIDPSMFRTAQQVLCLRTLNRSNQDILDNLRRLLRRKGKLTMALIAEANLPAKGAIKTRFGSLSKAYALLGYSDPKTVTMLETRDRSHAVREKLIAQLTSLFPKELTVIQRGANWRTRLRLKTGRHISVLIARVVRRSKDAIRWQAEPVSRERGLFTLLVRLDLENGAVHDFYLLPKIVFRARFTIRLNDSRLRIGEYFNRPSDFLGAVQRLTNHSKTGAKTITSKYKDGESTIQEFHRQNAGRLRRPD